MHTAEVPINLLWAAAAPHQLPRECGGGSCGTIASCGNVGGGSHEPVATFVSPAPVQSLLLGVSLCTPCMDPLFHMY